MSWSFCSTAHVQDKGFLPLQGSLHLWFVLWFPAGVASMGAAATSLGHQRASVCPGEGSASQPFIVVVEDEHQMKLAAISNRRVSHEMRSLWASWRVPGEKPMNHTLVREPRAPDLLQVIPLSRP